jgi:Tol biopolymer transport system component
VLSAACALALTACSSPAQAPASPEPSSAAPTPSPAPTAVPVLPGEAWIVYQWGAPCLAEPTPSDTICLARPDGTGAHPLPLTTPGEGKHPDWSPDGAQVTFVLNDSIWIAGVDGADARSVRTCDGDCDYPAWSPDGKQIAYTRTIGPAIANGPPSSSAIEIVDVDSGEITVVTRTERLQLADQPRWSPDGDTLVIQLEQFKDDGSEIGASIAILPAKAGSMPKAITDQTLFGTYADWNPMKDEIVFTTHEYDASGAPVRLYTVRTDGSGLKELAYDGADGERSSHPSWTPDGKQVLFVQMNTRTAALVNADGTGLVLIDRISATHPRLRPTP